MKMEEGSRDGWNHSLDAEQDVGRDCRRDQLVLLSSMCQMLVIWSMTSAGAITVYHHIGRAALCRKDLLTVIDVERELGRSAQMALCMTCVEQLL